jgi:hypothetical protein
MSVAWFCRLILACRSCASAEATLSMLGRSEMRAMMVPFFTVWPATTYSLSTTPDTCDFTSISRRGITLPVATAFLTMVIRAGLSS